MDTTIRLVPFCGKLLCFVCRCKRTFSYCVRTNKPLKRLGQRVNRPIMTKRLGRGNCPFCRHDYTGSGSF